MSSPQSRKGIPGKKSSAPLTRCRSETTAGRGCRISRRLRYLGRSLCIFRSRMGWFCIYRISLDGYTGRYNTSMPTLIPTENKVKGGINLRDGSKLTVTGNVFIVELVRRALMNGRRHVRAPATHPPDNGSRGFLRQPFAISASWLFPVQTDRNEPLSAQPAFICCFHLVCQEYGKDVVVPDLRQPPIGAQE
jgi:hypothetical protein